MDWPRVIKNVNNLRGTRRWCQRSKRNFLQDGWNGKYEFSLFDARKQGEKALPVDFANLMQEVDEEMQSRSDSPVSGEVSWANEMQVTTGELLEEQPFSEDEDVFALDFPEESRNDWDNREWRDSYEIALNEAFQRVYDRNEEIKNDPEKANLKPADIDPFWSHALQEIKHRNREEDRKVQENMEGLAELPAIEIEDESEVTASAIDTATDSEPATNEEVALQVADLNDAIIGIESNLLDDTESNNAGSIIEVDTQDLSELQDEEVAEVLVIERQEEIITNDKDEANQDDTQAVDTSAVVASFSRFDADSFKARLIEFRKRQEIEWIYRNINKS